MCYLWVVIDKNKQFIVNKEMWSQAGPKSSKSPYTIRRVQARLTSYSPNLLPVNIPTFAFMYGSSCDGTANGVCLDIKCLFSI